DLNNYVFKVNDFQYSIGNPDLRPQYVHRLELSYRLGKQTIAAYYNKTVDAINGVYTLDGDIAIYQRKNAGAQTQYGIEYNRTGQLTSWWFVKASASIFHRKFTNPEGIDSFERTSGYLNLSNTVKINSTTSIDLSGVYLSKQEDAFYILSERYRVNIMLQKTFWNKKLSCRLYVTDLLDTFEFNTRRPFDTFETTLRLKFQTRTLRHWMSYNFSNQSKVNKRSNSSDGGVRRRL
ncbi:MAG: outer membrane beta-barrel protein, partial [Bacteroidota bacterium]